MAPRTIRRNTRSKSSSNVNTSNDVSNEGLPIVELQDLLIEDSIQQNLNNNNRNSDNSSAASKLMSQIENCNVKLSDLSLSDEQVITIVNEKRKILKRLRLIEGNDEVVEGVASSTFNPNKKTKISDLDLKVLDLDKDDLNVFLDTIEDKVFINELDPNYGCKILLNFLEPASDPYNFVKAWIKNHPTSISWEALKSEFSSKYKQFDTKIKAIHQIMNFKFTENEALESARMRYVKLVKLTEEQLDNTFIIMYFINALPKDLHTNFTLLYKDHHFSNWTNTFECIKNAQSITYQQQNSNNNINNYNQFNQNNIDIVAHLSNSNNTKSTNNNNNKSFHIEKKQPNYTSTNNKKKVTINKPCRYFARGHCTAGSNCKFKHVITSD